MRYENVDYRTGQRRAVLNTNKSHKRHELYQPAEATVSCLIKTPLQGVRTQIFSPSSKNRSRQFILWNIVLNFKINGLLFPFRHANRSLSRRRKQKCMFSEFTCILSRLRYMESFIHHSSVYEIVQSESTWVADPRITANTYLQTNA